MTRSATTRSTKPVLHLLYNLIRWSRQKLHGSNKVGLGSTFRHKRDGDDSECVVCLSAFEEGEELRRLPECRHTFHAPCIDTWLYSHMDCPLCRRAVEVPGLKQRPTAEERSREGLLVPVALF